MSSPTSPHTPDQVNAQSPASGGNANIFVVSPRPSRLPNRVSHLTTCLPCLLPSSPNALALLPKTKKIKQTKNSPPSLPLSLPTLPSPHSPLPQWLPKGNPALPLSYIPPPGLPSLPITRNLMAPVVSPQPLTSNLPQPPTSALHPPAQMRTSPPIPHQSSDGGSDGQTPSALSPFPNFTSPLPLPPTFPVSLDSQALPLTIPLPIYSHP